MREQLRAFTVRMSTQPRILQRIVGILGGRACEIVALRYVQNAGSPLAHMEVLGTPRQLQAAMARIAQLPHVLRVNPELGGSSEVQDLPFEHGCRLAVTRFRSQARQWGESQMFVAAVVVALDGDEALGAGEGHGTIEALAEAVQQALQTLRPEHPPLVVANVDVDVQSLGSTPSVTVSAEGLSDHGSFHSRGRASDVDVATLRALLALHQQLLARLHLTVPPAQAGSHSWGWVSPDFGGHGL